jgi:hypothetical protein
MNVTSQRWSSSLRLGSYRVGSLCAVDHVCFIIPDYDAKVAIDRLEAKNIEPDVEADRTHFWIPTATSSR